MCVPGHGQLHCGCFRGMATRKRPQQPRALSASEIARNYKSFEIWQSLNNCEQVSFTDIPADFKPDVAAVFDFNSKIPHAWVDKKSPEYKSLRGLAGKHFMSFLQQVHADSPSLFDANIAGDALEELLPRLTIVHSAWRKLKSMNKSEKWSEADYAANVYNVIRAPAIRESTHRVQCNVSLPQPSDASKLSPESRRVLGAKQATPDCIVLLPARSVRALSSGIDSPYKRLSRHPIIKSAGSASQAFRFQSTPLVIPPDAPGFQFISSIWEDKGVHSVSDAYRQNRMATTAVARHLHSLHVQAPVFALVWASRGVRAHVDWCSADASGKHAPPVVYSAPYQKAEMDNDQEEEEGDDRDVFYEWQLERAGHIVEVFFMCEAIDRYTAHAFRDRVVAGVHDLLDSVANKGKRYSPWKRAGDLFAGSLQTNKGKENRSRNQSISAGGSTSTASASHSSSAQSSPTQKSRQRSRRNRR
ncbi:hypothetical protein MKEN_00796300 [Mycena kentingensis (nom. inval.)]|nr:hypothetical protein MKEN_00796300 [Mycena kentingensis (nom. inval.)]